MRKRRLNSGYSGNVDNRRNIKGCTPVSKHYMERVLGFLDSRMYFLDNFPGASAAYSLRSLDGNFDNPVVQVRRSIDNNEADFTATEVSDGTLEAWCGAGDGLVKTLYDQSGHGRHGSQSTATAQPKIVSGGVLVLENGLPAMEFDGTDDFLVASHSTSLNISSTEGWTLAGVLAQSGGFRFLQKGNGTGTNDTSHYFYNPGNGLGVANAYASAGGPSASGDQSLAFARWNTTTSGQWFNGSKTNFTSAIGGTIVGGEVDPAATPSSGNTDDLYIGKRNYPSGTEGNFDGTIQELIIYPVDQSANRVAIEDNINSHYNVFDPTVLLLHMDGTNGSTTFTDSSLNNFTVTANGDAQISTAQSKFGGASAAFDGSGDYLSVPSNAAFAFGTGDFTIEAWVFLNSLGTVKAICQKGVTSGAYGGWGFYIVDNAVAFICDSNTSGPWDVFITTGTAATSGAWHHVAVTRHGSTFTTWLNGMQSSSAASSNAILDQGASLTIGALASGAEPFNGYIDDLRITKGRALYTANFTPPTQAHPDPVPADPYFNQVSLLLPMDGADGSNTFVDKSKNAFAVTPYGDASISTAQSKFGGSSAYFDGTGDYLSVAANSAFAFGTGDFTVEFWLQIVSSALQQTVDQWANSIGSYLTGQWMTRIQSDGTVSFFVATGASTNQNFASSTALATGTFYHLAIVRSSGVIKMYIDGAEDASTLSHSGQVGLAGSPLSLGIQSNSSTNLLNGYIDSLRITKGIARYTSTFTPPTAPHPHL